MTKPFVIPKALVWEAFQRVKANGGSAGVDDESIAEFEERLGDKLYKLWNRMGSGCYFPPPVKAVPIPKKSGGTRTLGVPTVADRVAQTVVKIVLEPLLEPVFDRDSFGYRPANAAVAPTRKGLADRAAIDRRTDSRADVVPAPRRDALGISREIARGRGHTGHPRAPAPSAPGDQGGARWR